MIKSSHLQSALFRQYKKDTTRTDMNLAFGFTVKNLDRNRFENALQKVVLRHESLRTVFFEKDGTVWRTVLPSEENCGSRRKIIEDFAENDLTLFIRPFDLENGPLFRIAVKDDLVLMDFCHIITDGLSVLIFFSELNELYSGNELLSIPPTTAECIFDDEQLLRNNEYWSLRLEKPFEPLILPRDFENSSPYGGKGNSLAMNISSKLATSVSEKCRKMNVTPFVFYMTAFCLFLKEVCKKNDILTGTNFSGRGRKNLKSLDLYATIAPVRVKFLDEDSYAECVQKMNRFVRDSLNHQIFDLQAVLEEKNLGDFRDAFRTLFTYESDKFEKIRLGTSDCSYVPISARDSTTDFNICFFPFKKNPVILLIYRSDLFKKKTAERYIMKYIGIIGKMTERC